jgi:hypothetical protein
MIAVLLTRPKNFQLVTTRALTPIIEKFFLLWNCEREKLEEFAPFSLLLSVLQRDSLEIMCRFNSDRLKLLSSFFYPVQPLFKMNANGLLSAIGN